MTVDPRTEGFEACLDGVFRRSNPYPIGSQPEAEWYLGWDEAQPMREAWEEEMQQAAQCED